MVGRTAPKLKERRRVGFGGIPLDTPPLAAGSFISSAVSEKISAVMTEDYLEKRVKRAKKRDFRKILAKVPDRQPLPGDEV